MYFSKADIIKLKSAYAEIESKYQDIILLYTRRTYTQKEAEEFAKHGFARRIKTIKRCIDNIYRICPPDIDRKLSSEELSDLVINLQSFIFNVFGSLDNLAFVWVKEKEILNKKGEPLSNRKISFKSIRGTFSLEFRSYLISLQKWFVHIEGFRHSLAHRIPLYVPPYVSNEEEAKKEQELEILRAEALIENRLEEYHRITEKIEELGKFVPWMTHSFGENSPVAVFHPQIIADWNTVIEISQRIAQELGHSPNHSNQTA